MKTLHVIRRAEGGAVEGAIRPGDAVLLVQEGVGFRPPVGVEVFACGEDVEARGAEFKGKRVGYGEMVELMLKYERVVVW